MKMKPTKFVVWCMLCSVSLATVAQAETTLPYPDIADTSHATQTTAKFFHRFFADKSLHDPVKTMSYFSQGPMFYVDTTLGWSWANHLELATTFEKYMPTWPPSGKSYPTLILGDEKSVVVGFTDTPELFGGEIRILGAVDLKDGKIVRWADYWDGRYFGSKTVPKMRTPPGKFPTDFKETLVGEQASPPMRQVAGRLTDALRTGDAATAAKLFSYDAVYVDQGLRLHIEGRNAIARYLERAITSVPYGKGSALRHVLGGDKGGGYEWIAAQGGPVDHGITALILAPSYEITKLITVWDTSLLSDANAQGLMIQSQDP
jgi:hypothetical protein